ncbi:hypothetical protein ACHAXA_011176 [Cyclostephanos tholiformis]|uniref:Uncharacterized protein n=1 Tax=Cyclostephanos tholiformis TaxID=382380 RepID=A0ABD3R8S9_9STRA
MMQHEGWHGGGGPPTISTLFDDLSPRRWDREELGGGMGEGGGRRDDDYRVGHVVNDEDVVSTVRITYFSGFGTAVGINISHLLGDASSCFRICQVWGRAMRCLDHPLGASNARAYATLTGMATPETASLLHDLGGGSSNDRGTRKIVLPPPRGILSSFFDDYIIGDGTSDSVIVAMEKATMTRRSSDNEMDQNNNTSHRDEFSHEYVILDYSPELLTAMKAYGMDDCRKRMMHPDEGAPPSATARLPPSTMPFVSTNDMISAMGWMIKRRTAERMEWNLSTVVNLRSRGGIDGFGNLDDPTIGIGVFGNALTSVVAELPPSNGEDITMAEVSDAANAIRESLTRFMADIHDRRALSLLENATQTPDQGRCFSTTSWRQFSIWDISFGDDDVDEGKESSAAGLLDDFYGRPSYPLPVGDTYSSVAVPSRGGGCTYKLLAPSRRVQSILTLHREISAQFLEWAGMSAP